MANSWKFMFKVESSRFNLYFQYPFRLVRDKRSLLALEDDRIGLQGFKSVPNVLGDVYTVDAVFCAKHHRLLTRL